MSENLTPENSMNTGSAQQQNHQQNQQQQQQQQEQDKRAAGGNDLDGEKDPYDITDQSADKYTSTSAQFADLHDRLQGMTHHISNVFRTVSKHARAGDQQRVEIKALADLIKSDVVPRLERVAEVEKRVAGLEAQLRDMRREINANVKNSERVVRQSLGEHHESLTSNVAAAMPGHGRLIGIIIGSQVVAAVWYWFYKRRRANSHKKFL